MLSTTTTTATIEKRAMSSKARDQMSIIVSYPILISQEEGMAKTPHNVTGWSLYLQQLDNLIEILLEKKKKSPATLGGKSLIGIPMEQVQRELIVARCFVAERAVTLLPGSYKLWRNHLSFLTATTITHRKIATAFEQCLVRLHKMPRIWLEYLEFSQANYANVTTIRRLYDRALQALPVTQHDRIWDPYLVFLQQACCLQKDTNDNTNGKHHQHQQQSQSPPLNIPSETILRVMRRHIRYDPSAREKLANVCIQIERWAEAGLLFLDILNDTTFVSPLGSSRHDLWMKLADVCTLHPQDVSRAGIDFDAIVRAALPQQKTSQSSSSSLSWSAFDKLSEQQEQNGKDGKVEEGNTVQKQQLQLQAQLGEMEGTLWTKLADFHIRSGEFELARSIYEEALESVSKVRDFSIIFDAYVKFEEGVIEAMMALQGEDDDDGDGNDSIDQHRQANQEAGDWDILLGGAAQEEGQGDNSMADIELALARAEHLTSRRPVLLNRVLLRQNPHNVGEWIKRCDLYLQRKIPKMAAAALEESLQTLIAKKAVNGTPSELVNKLAKVYEDDLHDTKKARTVYDRICQQQVYHFRDVEDLSQCYAAWVELELRHEVWDDALSIARRAVANPESGSTKIARALPRSLRLWDLLLDLEESLGTPQTTKDAYNRALELQVATPMHVVNFATFLTDHKYFEESFTAYERGVELFAFPHPGAKVLWKNYLTSFIQRYTGSKMERVRDLFERCVETCPPEISSEFFMLNGDYEEEHGLTKRALGVYKAMCSKVPPDEKYTAYQLFIAKTIKYLGIPATRDIYQEAIAALQDTPAAQMCLDFAKMETSLQEIERARAVFAFGAQLADPRRDPEYWKAWHEFEVSNGNEETFREMLRVKRSVQAAFSTVNYNAAEMGAGSEQSDQALSNEEALRMLEEREGISSKEQQPRIGGFVQGKRTAELAELGDVENRVAKLRKATANAIDVKQQDISGAAVAGDDEIDLDDEIDIDGDDDGDGGEDKDVAMAAEGSSLVRGVSTKAVPSAVFGGLAPSADAGSSADNDPPKMGALERLRAAAASKS